MRTWAMWGQWAVLSTFIFLPNLGISGPLSENDRYYLLYGTWRLPSQFSNERIEKLLTLASGGMYLSGYRYLGEDGDFFHGHMLFEERKENGKSVLYPRAILYHTQEDAHAAHWGERGIDPKYDYLDPKARNWIQWLSDDPALDGVKIENARVYVDGSKRDPKQFFESKPPQKIWHYTIHSHQLDARALGFSVFSSLQFEFHTTACSYVPDIFNRGPFLVPIPHDDTACLKVNGAGAYVESSIYEKKTAKF